MRQSSDLLVFRIVSANRRILLGSLIAQQQPTGIFVPVRTAFQFKSVVLSTACRRRAQQQLHIYILGYAKLCPLSNAISKRLQIISITIVRFVSSEKPSCLFWRVQTCRLLQPSIPLARNMKSWCQSLFRAFKSSIDGDTRPM